MNIRSSDATALSSSKETPIPYGSIDWEVLTLMLLCGVLLLLA
eukprot:CAMPEP_0174239624 /NCGR_PEP_ID=MMETSP0417-20130205/15453_1 /TAXON_ID=242541 /ORGANISM="Mayorella sp, Strain BSH-02190019" /LENGTH=42 /DNA_ID= /DNA_START= /DNA_END= /DNA_ORIENTATION=